MSLGVACGAGHPDGAPDYVDADGQMVDSDAQRDDELDDAAVLAQQQTSNDEPDEQADEDPSPVDDTMTDASAEPDPMDEPEDPVDEDPPDGGMAGEDPPDLSGIPDHFRCAPNDDPTECEPIPEEEACWPSRYAIQCDTDLYCTASEFLANSFWCRPLPPVLP